MHESRASCVVHREITLPSSPSPLQEHFFCCRVVGGAAISMSSSPRCSKINEVHRRMGAVPQVPLVDEEYVANLLAEEASRRRQSYNTMGIAAYTVHYVMLWVLADSAYILDLGLSPGLSREGRGNPTQDNHYYPQPMVYLGSNTSLDRQS